MKRMMGILLPAVFLCVSLASCAEKGADALAAGGAGISGPAEGARDMAGTAYRAGAVRTAGIAPNGGKTRDTEGAPAAEGSPAKGAENLPDKESLLLSLDQFAELERSGLYKQGMGLAESSIRENLGDYAGAVAAAYKELAWAYGLGIVKKEALETGVNNVLALEGKDVEETALNAARGILAFTRGRWDDAEKMLLPLFVDEEPDGFARWMILACALERNSGNRQAASSYRSIRARYAKFPEYWYHGARAFSGLLAAEYAEQCIVLAPAGPFAAECRALLAASAGLKPGDGAALKSRAEIEALVSRSVAEGDPLVLEPLMPLIALPENPYTVYAVGALRALASVPRFRDYFSGRASRSAGRLAERLGYICRG
jgi:hypothetical protein